MSVKVRTLGSYDFIVVGGGAAGCVVASRLSADPKNRVLLIEAGEDFAPGREPEALRDRGHRTFMLPQYQWAGLIEERGKPVTLGKVIGGGSAVNGMHAQRGFPADYDEWRDLGAEGWGWNDVLPYFRKLETDADFGGPMHGADGPIAVRRVPESEWSPLTLAFREVLERRGLPRLKDINAETGDGSAATPLNNTAEARSSTSMAYLSSEVRARRNLRILARTTVKRLVLKRFRVIGVELQDGSMISGREVILCAGAIHSPVLLMRSGVGPGSVLQEAGRNVLVHRPGVGRNLANHPMLTVSAFIRHPARQHRYRSVRQGVPLLVRYSSKAAGEPSDMALNLWERTPGPLADDPLGRQIAQVGLLLNKSYSRGSVRLDPSSPTGLPIVHTNIFGDHRDLARMSEGFRFICELLSQPPLSQLVEYVFVANKAMGIPTDRLTSALFQDNLRARTLSIMGALTMDWIPPLRHRFLRNAGRSAADILAKPDHLDDFIRSATGVGGHPAGTCRLGALDDPLAVADSRCRAIGTEGLRIVDASLFPTLMRAGPHIPVIMVAEKAADMILQDARA